MKMTFADLALAPCLLQALADEGYVSPTPIQAQSIPMLLKGRDMLGMAQTGTGKTAAFALPLLHRLAADPRPAPKGGARVLVLAPTRELVSQIATGFETFGRHMGPSVTTIFGGVSQFHQVNALEAGIDIIVATPGRLLDLIEQGLCDLSALEALVLDEADQMLDMGFAKPIERIVAALPVDRHTVLFSATMPKSITALVESLLRNPANVEIAPPSTTVERIEQSVMFMDAAHKKAALLDLLRTSGGIHAAKKYRQRGLCLHQRGGDHRRGTAWQQVARSARTRTGRVPRRDCASACGDGYRRARNRCRHGDACVQPRPAEPAGELCPPDRPHRSRRAQRLCHHAMRCRATRVAA